MNTPDFIKREDVISHLESGIFTALENYSNVHRGSGFKSQVSTALYEEARNIVLDFLDLDKAKYTVVFCSPARARQFIRLLNPGMYQQLSSEEFGLAIGVRAIAVRKNALPAGTPVHTGGGSARLISPGWVVWSAAPDKFEAGTPAIINVITFARVLMLSMVYGRESFLQQANAISVEAILNDDEFISYSGKVLLDKLRNTLIGNDVKISSPAGEKLYINLDNGASTPAFVPVWDTFRKSMKFRGEQRKDIAENVKSIISGFIKADRERYDIFFTSNTTESINLTALSLAHSSGNDYEMVIVNTLLEHSSDELPWRNVPGAELIRLTVDEHGFINLKELDSLVKDYNLEKKYGSKRIKLVAISGSSNVLGICNRIAEISKIVHSYGAELLVDAAQLVAHRPIDLGEFEADYLVFSGHKIYAPFGTGVLVARKGLMNESNSELMQLLASGNENTAGIAALGKSLLLLKRVGMDIICQEEKALTAKALKEMIEIEGLTIYGVSDVQSPDFERKCGVIVFSMKNVWPDKIALRLARAGIGVRYGCHCAHLLIKHLLHIPPSLQKLQRIMVTLFPGMVLPGVVRVSLGIGNTEKDIDCLISELKIISQNRSGSDTVAQTETLINDVVRRVYHS